MDINNLHAFIAVAEKKSFSRSAESLNLTQPAVSKRIAALESELDSRLFDRVGRTVHLTEIGKVLLPSALKISSEVARIENEIISLGSVVGGKLSIGAAEHVEVERLATMLKSYKESYPDVEIDVQFLQSEEALDKIENGRLDMSLCSVNEKLNGHKSHTSLLNIQAWEENLHLVVEKSHPLALKRSVSVAELAKYPGILPQQSSAIRQSIEQLMTSNSVTAEVAVEAIDFQTTRSMAAIGLGWAFLPNSEIDDNLVEVDMNDARLGYSVALVRNPDRSLSRAAKAFVNSLSAKIGVSANNESAGALVAGH